jgi:hypothetical protein
MYQFISIYRFIYICIYVLICIYIYMYIVGGDNGTSSSSSSSGGGGGVSEKIQDEHKVSMYTSIYTCIYIYMCIYIYINICMYLVRHSIVRKAILCLNILRCLMFYVVPNCTHSCMIVCLENGCR